MYHLCTKVARKAIKELSTLHSCGGAITSLVYSFFFAGKNPLRILQEWFFLKNALDPCQFTLTNNRRPSHAYRVCFSQRFSVAHPVCGRCRAAFKRVSFAFVSRSDSFCTAFVLSRIVLVNYPS